MPNCKCSISLSYHFLTRDSSQLTTTAGSTLNWHGRVAMVTQQEGEEHLQLARQQRLSPAGEAGSHLAS